MPLWKIQEEVLIIYRPTMIFRYRMLVLCTAHLKNCVGWQPSVYHWLTKSPFPSVAHCTGMYSLSLQVCNLAFETEIAT
jgi:hypothetical protein